MDEYFCPNCGAILNDQYGFDPDNGTWECTECGQHLMDDDVYDGDTFEGIAWYCDDCGALLNRQSGFSDSYGSWKCTECGYVNGTTEDDIINEDELLECPNCNDVLNHQYGFNEYDDDWECSCCGAKLHRNYMCDPYEILDEDDTEYDEVDEEEECYWEDDEDDEEGNEYIPRKQTKYSKKSSKTSKQKDRSWVGILILFAVIIGFCFGVVLYYEIREKNAIRDGKINAGYYKDFVDEDYKTVEAHFRAAGFTNIELIDLNDAGIMFWKNEDVEFVSIAGNSTFNSDDWFYPDAKVVISYH